MAPLLLFLPVGGPTSKPTSPLRLVARARAPTVGHQQGEAAQLKLPLSILFLIFRNSWPHLEIRQKFILAPKIMKPVS